MKLTNGIVTVISILTGGLVAILYSALVPIINEWGGCVGGQGFTIRTCESLIGVDLPIWFQPSPGIYIDTSLLVGFWGGLLIGLFLLMKRQSNSV
ncbi:hypothetical protein MCT05_18475 [Vibrio aestuarianus]|nr:hypothetical protein [Vibrio aestuarianus]